MTYRPLKIGIDLNKVVLDTLGGLHKLSCELIDARIPPEQFGGKNIIGRSFPSRSGIGRAEFTQAHYERVKAVFFESPHFFEYATPLHGAVRALQMARACGHTFVLVSDVRGLPETTLERWWKTHRLPSCEHVLTRGKESKTAHYSGCDVVIDNDLTHLVPLVKTGARLLHMLPADGAVGCRAVIIRPRGTPPQISSVRGWSGVLQNLREVDPALAA